MSFSFTSASIFRGSGVILPFSAKFSFCELFMSILAVTGAAKFSLIFCKFIFKPSNLCAIF